MSEEKFIITDDMIQSFADMLKGSKDDSSLAMGIINGRDKTDVDSEKNFIKIGELILSNDKLFGRPNQYSIKFQGQILCLGSNQTAMFRSKTQALAALSRHLTNYLGKSAKKFQLSKEERRYIKWKTTPLKINEYRPSYIDSTYDPSFDKVKYIEQCKQSRWTDTRSSDPYFKALKQMFGGGSELRDFLVNNNLIEIIKT